MIGRPHFYKSNAELRDLVKADRAGVVAELAYRKSRAARKLASELGCPTARGPAEPAPRRRKCASKPRSEPRRTRARAPDTWRVLRAKEVTLRSIQECRHCRVELPHRDWARRVTLVGPDGIDGCVQCFKCDTRHPVEVGQTWTIDDEGAAIELEGGPVSVPSEPLPAAADADVPS